MLSPRIDAFSVLLIALLALAHTARVLYALLCLVVLSSLPASDIGTSFAAMLTAVITTRLNKRSFKHIV